MEFDFVTIGTIAIRGINAVLWTAVAYRIFNDGVPLSPLFRRLVTTVIVFGMWCLVLGGATGFGFPGDAARFIYTTFTAYAAIVALAIATDR